MLAVLGLLLFISLVVAGLYLQSEEHLMTTQSVASQQMAMQRAEEGLQVALQGIRAGLIPIASVTQPCSEIYARNCGVVTNLVDPARFSVAPVDRGTTLELREGGGLQYEYHIIKRPTLGNPIFRYLVQAVGFYGYNNSRNMVTSIVEADVDVGNGTGTDPARDNEY